MDKAEVMVEALKIDGWFTPRQLSLIYDLAMEHLPEHGEICELGTYKGRSTYVWACVAKEKHAFLTTIDIFNNSDEFMKENAERNLKGFNLRIIKGTTDKSVSNFLDKTLDICFIDADHEYKAVMSDINNYLPKVKVGGILCGHDYGRGDVSQAIKDSFKDDFILKEDIWIKEIK
jgi:predicted O-methyltransferase YrrM